MGQGMGCERCGFESPSRCKRLRCNSCRRLVCRGCREVFGASAQGARAMHVECGDCQGRRRERAADAFLSATDKS